MMTMSREGEKSCKKTLVSFSHLPSRSLTRIKSSTSSKSTHLNCTQTLSLLPSFQKLTILHTQEIPRKFQRHGSQVGGLLCGCDQEGKEEYNSQLQKLRQIAVGSECPKVNFWTSKLLISVQFMQHPSRASSRPGSVLCP